MCPALVYVPAMLLLRLQRYAHCMCPDGSWKGTLGDTYDGHVMHPKALTIHPIPTAANMADKHAL